MLQRAHAIRIRSILQHNRRRGPDSNTDDSGRAGTDQRKGQAWDILHFPVRCDRDGVCGFTGMVSGRTTSFEGLFFHPWSDGTAGVWGGGVWNYMLLLAAATDALATCVWV